MILKKLKRILKKNEIIRRYTVVNSFDGTLAVLGVVLANFVAGVSNPKTIIFPSLGATFAMFVSGVWSAYLSEQAEFKKSLGKLERHLLKRLDGTKPHEKMRKNVLWVALANGAGPLITGLLIIFPFFFFNQYSYYISFAITAFILFSLGTFLGEVAKEKRISYGLKMISAGLIVAFFFYVLTVLGLM